MQLGGPSFAIVSHCKVIPSTGTGRESPAKGCVSPSSRWRSASLGSSAIRRGAASLSSRIDFSSDGAVASISIEPLR